VDRLLRNNTVLRLLALVLACILWFSVTAGGGSAPVTGGITQRFPFPVHVLVDADEVATSVDTTTAEVVVTGDAVSLTSLPGQMANVELVADARGYGPGQHQVRITAHGMPPISYTIQPATVTVVIEPKVTATKRVEVTLSGQPATGYRAGVPSVEPAQVQVFGPKAAVQAVDRVAATLSIAGASHTVTQTVGLVALDSAGSPVPGVTLSLSRVTIVVPVQPPQVTLRVEPTLSGQPADGWAVAGVRVEPAVATVYGVPVDGSWTQVAAPVDVNGWSSTRTVQVPLRLAPGMTKADPAQVSVTVTIERSLSRQIPNVPVTLAGRPNGGTAQLVGHPTVDVHRQRPRQHHRAASDLRCACLCRCHGTAPR
jgi:YbbR domain-containing protein